MSDDVVNVWIIFLSTSLFQFICQNLGALCDDTYQITSHIMMFLTEKHCKGDKVTWSTSAMSLLSVRKFLHSVDCAWGSFSPQKSCTLVSAILLTIHGVHSLHKSQKLNLPSVKKLGFYYRSKIRVLYAQKNKRRKIFSSTKHAFPCQLRYTRTLV